MELLPGDIGVTDENIILSTMKRIIDKPVKPMLAMAGKDLEKLLDFASTNYDMDKDELTEKITFGELLNVISNSDRNISEFNAFRVSRIFETMSKYDHSFEIIMISNLKSFLYALENEKMRKDFGYTLDWEDIELLSKKDFSNEFLSMAEANVPLEDEACRLPIYKFKNTLYRYGLRGWAFGSESIEVFEKDILEICELYSILFVDAPCLITKSNRIDIIKKYGF